MNDLRSVRKKKGLRIEDLAGGMITSGTLISIEKGQRVAQDETRRKLEMILGGKIDWRATLSGGDRGHIIRSLSEFVNENEAGAISRIKFARQALSEIEKSIKE